MSPKKFAYRLVVLAKPYIKEEVAMSGREDYLVLPRDQLPPVPREGWRWIEITRNTDKDAGKRRWLRVPVHAGAKAPFSDTGSL